MYERLKKIREYKKMSQAEFAKLLGIGQSTLAMMETGKREILDRHIKTICSICKVNENWLRTGEGKMINEDRNTLISQLTEEYDLDMLDRKIVECYLNLGLFQRKAVKDYLRSIIDAVIDNEDNYKEYRNDYINDKAMPFAARSGEVDNIEQAKEEYDSMGNDKLDR